MKIVTIILIFIILPYVLSWYLQQKFLIILISIINDNYCYLQQTRLSTYRRLKVVSKYLSHDQILQKILSEDIVLKSMAIEILNCT